jgi:hypothetical protein
LVAALIDLGQYVADVDVLPFLKRNLLELTVDLGPHGHGIEGLDGPDALHMDWHVLPDNRGRNDRYRSIEAMTPPSTAASGPASAAPLVYGHIVIA